MPSRGPNVEKNGNAHIMLVCARGSCLLLYRFGAHGKFEDSYLRFNTFVQSLFLVSGALTALVIQKRDIRIPLVIRPLMLAAGLGAWLIAFLEVWDCISAGIVHYLAAASALFYGAYWCDPDLLRILWSRC